MSNLRVILEKRGALVLSSNDHLATGGEGSVYKKAGTVIKIFTDLEKMKRDRMADKIRLLSALQHEYIVAPSALVLDEQGKEIGYYMPFAEGEPLSRLFTSDYRQRVGITDKDTSILTERMREAVLFAHDNRAVMVDANELNWIADLGGNNGPKPLVLDVDSWAIDRWPAKVIMLSIRDHHTNTFNSLTDWFSWGIVTFQLYTGIHPYKGILDGYKVVELERRMKDNASVFTPGVRLNRAVRDFSCIPGRLRDWYQATFQKGSRSIPPSPFDTGAAVTKVAAIARTVITVSGKLAYEKIFGKTNDPAIRVYPCGVVLLTSGLLVDSFTKREIGHSVSRDCEVVKVIGGWIKGMKRPTGFEYVYIDETNYSETMLLLPVKIHRMVRYENRLFAVTDQGLAELNLTLLGRPILSVGKTWGVMVNSTRWYDGVGIQDAMGATYLIAPFGDDACAQVRVRELDGHTPVAAKAGYCFISVMTLNRKGEYIKFEFTFGIDYKTYKVWNGDAVSPDLNVAILPKGVCATILEDGELIIFVPSNGKVMKVQDKAVTTEMALNNWGNTVVYILDGNVWKVSLK